jgi:hypothetical protein
MAGASAVAPPGAARCLMLPGSAWASATPDQASDSKNDLATKILNVVNGDMASFAL